MRDRLCKAVLDGMGVIGQLKLSKSLSFMEGVARGLAACFATGGKVIVAGNGGSLCDAMHFAEELTGFFRSRTRVALPAIALSCPGHITCVGNDVGFNEIFSRGIEAYGAAGDWFVGLTTSGNSANLVRAFEVAANRGLTTVAFLGRDGGQLRGLADHELLIEGFGGSDRIQEAHMCAIHIIIEEIERLVVSDVQAELAFR